MEIRKQEIDEYLSLNETKKNFISEFGKVEKEWVELMQQNHRVTEEIIFYKEKKLDFENKEYVIILNALDENRKPLYSNEKKRELALDEKLKFNKEYFEIKEKMKGLEAEQRETKMKLEVKSIELKNARALIRFLTE